MNKSEVEIKEELQKYFTHIEVKINNKKSLQLSILDDDNFTNLHLKAITALEKLNLWNKFNEIFLFSYKL